MCIRISIFNLLKKKEARKKAKETNTRKRISVENLTGYDNIEFNVVHVQRQKSEYLLYYNNI